MASTNVVRMYPAYPAYLARTQPRASRTPGPARKRQETRLSHFWSHCRSPTASPQIPPFLIFTFSSYLPFNSSDRSILPNNNLARLSTVDNEEAAKRRREEARNSLEGYLYRIRDLLDDYSETPFMKCSQESERKAIADRLQQTFAWLNEEGDHAETWQYLDKRSSLE